MTLTPLFSAAGRSVLALGLLGLATTAFAGEARFKGEGHAQSPNWSRDGKFISFEVNRYGQGGNNNIDMFITEVTGDVAKDALAVKMPGSSGSGMGGGAQTAGAAKWHPEGIVVFQASNTEGKFRIYFAQPGVSPSEMLSNSKAPGDLTSPGLSPDGNTMLYTSDATGDGDVYGWNRNTDATSQLSSDPMNELYAEFSNDGKSITFIRKSQADSDIFVIPAGGGAPTGTIGGGGEQTRPVFAMGNSRVVYFSNERNKDEWDLMTAPVTGGKGKPLATHVKLPYSEPPDVAGANQEWVSYTFKDPEKNDKVMLVKADGSATKTIQTNFKECEDPALKNVNGRWLLAYTALPKETDGWRFLYVQDITNQM